jgi:hypothetical protein
VSQNDPYTSLGAKFAAVREARERLEEMQESHLIGFEFFEEAMADLRAIREKLEAEQDSLAFTGPVSPVLSDEEIAALAIKVQDLQQHNESEAAARGILAEIVTAIGVAT